MFGRKCCCGGEVDCVILEDNFDRTNSTNIGSDWTEETGSWAISSNTLQGTGSGAVALTTASRTNAAVNYTVTATVSHRGRVVFDADGSGNYHYIEYNYVSSLISLGNESGVIEGVVISDLASYQTPITEITLKVCVTGSLILVNFGNLSTGAVGFSFTPHDGLKAGLGSGFAGTRTFNDFSFQVHEDTSAGCDACTGGCDTDCCSDGVTAEYVIDVPTLTITGASCDCAGAFTGGEMTLRQKAPCRWQYNNYDPDASIGDCYYGAELVLDGCEWTLRVFFGYYFDDPDSPGIDTGIDNDAYYTYTQSDPSDCGDFDYSLSLDTSSTPVDCSLTWPSTVGLAPAP